VSTVALGAIARTVAYNPDGTLLAVGFGGRVGKGKEKGGGMLRLYSSDPYSPKGVVKLAEVNDAKEWISDVKFSADGRTLAVGAHDCKIYIYTVDSTGSSATLKLRSTFAKHNSVINHLDLSADGRFMQSNCRYVK
jgi:WD40 repeat protein